MMFRTRSKVTKFRTLWLAYSCGAICLTLSLGCQDGPLYALKVTNPYYSLKEWRDEKAYGQTEYDRWQEMLSLSDSIQDLSVEDQYLWLDRFAEMLENEESAEMRRLVVVSAGQLDDPQSWKLIETGLKDTNTKVRMEACRSLGKRQDDDSLRLLATVIGSDTNQDVKNSAVTALASFQGEVAVDSLRVALSDRNPATRAIAIDSLRESTGKDYGNDPKEWIAALDGQQMDEEPTRFADRVLDFF